MTDGLLPDDLLRGHAAFITGGGSGINFGIARTLVKAGAAVSICGRTEQKLKDATAELRELNGDVSYSVADVRDSDAVQAAIDLAAERHGHLTTVIAGAAGNFFAAAEDLSPKGFRTVVDIDLFGTFHTAHAAFPHLRRSGGSLLFVSAGQAYMPFALQAHVGAAKAGIDNLMRNLANEWGPHGIRVNSIVPGPVGDTEGMKRLAGPTGQDTWTDSIPLGRFASTNEIASIATVLVSPLSSYMTGAQVVVDGGLSMSGFGRISQAVAEAAAAPERT